MDNTLSITHSYAVMLLTVGFGGIYNEYLVHYYDI